jgi:hypothetical protein
MGLWKQKLIVLVTGGRSYKGPEIAETLDILQRGSRGPIDLIVHGGARGADSIAQQWADANAVKAHTELANWKALGVRAGHARNKQMVDMVAGMANHGAKCVVVAAPGGSGTYNCIRCADKAGLEIIQI